MSLRGVQATKQSKEMGRHALLAMTESKKWKIYEDRLIRYPHIR
jgi:hypothetical protein